MANLKPGHTLERYKIVRELGSGGFGVTYLAASEDLEIKVAIKEYFPEEFAVRLGNAVKPRSGQIENFDWGKDKFIQEARTLAKFRHPNIVGVRQIFEANNTAYIVLDYESGRDLKAWRKEINDRPTENELIELTKPILAALKLIHSNGLLHRDISPDNIIVRNDGSPVLIDFGSSRVMTRQTRTVSAVVKSGYSPPEFYTSLTNSEGPWSDIYSYAATVYFLISGVTPEEATNRLIRDEQGQLTKRHKGQYSQTFLQTIDSALNLKIEQRPQNILELENTLGIRINIFPSPTAAHQEDQISRRKIRQPSRKNFTKSIKFSLAAGLSALVAAATLMSFDYHISLQSSTSADAITIDLSSTPVEEICRRALNSDRSDWGSGTFYQDKVREAERRSLRINDCRGLLGLPVITETVIPSDTANQKSDNDYYALPYKQYPQTEFWSGDTKQIRGIDFDACKDACDAKDAMCNAVTYYLKEDLCTLKRFSGDIEAVGRFDAVSAVKANPPQTVAEQNIDYLYDVSLTGTVHKEVNSDLNNCMFGCLNDNKCSAYVFKSQSSSCVMFSFWQNPKPTIGSISGRKR